MAWDLQELQDQIANEIDQDDAAPTADGTDWNIRLNALNRAQIDWAESYEWSSLHKIHNSVISASTGNASVALPSDFRKIDGFPRITYDGSNTEEFPVVNPSKIGQYVDTDRYVNVLGNERDNKVMYVHATTLASGASVQFTYWASPASLATTTSLTQCPDPTFLVQRSLYYLYKGREDGRFPEAKVESDRILARMIENENSLGRAYVDRSIPNWQTEKHHFRIGRD